MYLGERGQDFKEFFSPVQLCLQFETTTDVLSYNIILPRFTDSVISLTANPGREENVKL